MTDYQSKETVIENSDIELTLNCSKEKDDLIELILTWERWEMTMKKVAIIVGSLREKSFNRQLAGIADMFLKEKAEVVYLEYADIPYMNQDIEYPAPETVARVRNVLSSTDGIWIFTPEYNYNYPGVLKNLLDWLSRPLKQGGSRTDTAIAGKPVTISGVAGKSAAAGAIKNLKTLMGFLNVKLMESHMTGVALDKTAFQTNTLVLTQETETALKRQAKAFLDFMEC